MKKQTNTHHLHSLRIIMFGVLMIAATIVRLDAHALPSLTRQTSGVLSYATSMSRSDLLFEANASRSANGLAPLTLNSQLNNSAQAKAQHMVDNNYWAHVAPDGTQPWYFFEAAGYSYEKAGENLAYGFDSSYATNQGWMNSPGHRANIMGDYTDVGFGFVNGPNFQNSENTVVVAHYGKPLNYVAPAPAPAPAPTPTVQQSTSTTPSSAPTPAPTATPAQQTPTTTPTAKTEEAPKQAELATPKTSDTQPLPVATGTAKNVSILETIRSGYLPQVAMVSLGLTAFATMGYAFAHQRLMRHALATSERFVITHPTLDVFAIVATIALILSTTAARLQ